jgi:predicted MFS family arabinose efflux permease
LDKHSGYIDEAIAIAISGGVIGISTISFIFVTESIHVYIIQFFIGIGAAINLPAWRKTFAKFLDDGKEATEYSLYDIITNISIALMIALGGYLVADFEGFRMFFLVAGILSILGGLIALVLLKTKKIVG